MQILTVNGERKEFADGKFPATVSELLKVLGIVEATVVAEIDGKIVQRNNFATTNLTAGEAIELVRFVQGG